MLCKPKPSRLKKIVLTHVFVLGFLSLPYLVHAKPEIDIQYKYYSIYPKALTDLAQEMIDRGPNTNQGGYTVALTSSTIRWSYDTYEKQRYCYLKDISVEADITIHMPSIPRRFGAPANVMKGFTYLYGKIDQHEHLHVRNAEATSYEIEKYLKSARDSSCKALRKKAKVYGYQQLEKLRAKDKALDRQTQRQTNRLMMTYDY